MKQVAILPSGVQVLHSGSILHFNEDRILYAATLAVYVLNARTFMTEKILSLNTRAISSITISPYDANLLVVGAVDGSVCLWNIETEEVVSRINTMNGGVFVAWDPFSPNHCAVISNENNLKLFYWNVQKTSGGSLVELFSIRNAVRYTIARWNPNNEGQLAVGCNSGAVILFNHRDKSQKVLQHVESVVAGGINKSSGAEAVVDIQFDRLSALYMIVAYTFFIALWDVENCSEILVFDRQTIAITSIAWLDWTAGNFISTNGKNNHLKVWNASQKQPLEVIKISSEASSVDPTITFSGDNGINSVYFSPGKKRLLAANMNGSISVLNIGRKQVEYNSSCGHTETIFDCRINPANADQFVSTGFDGTVKFWNIHGLTLSRTIPSNNEIIYCIDWNPKGTMVVVSTVNGHVIIFEVESGREVARYQNHTKASYSVAWNKLTDNLIVSSSSDGSLVVMNVSPNILADTSSQSVPLGSRRRGDTSRDVIPADIRFQYRSASPLFGVAWSPTHAPILCCTSQEGIVRVFNHMMGIQFVSLFVGHTARSFGCAWSPLIKGYLATGGDDCNINLWNVDLNRCLTSTMGKEQAPLSVLKGHTMNVRGLQWSTEHESLLLSGSWDSVIRLWDVLSGVCLYELTDHIADVYAITSHPLRPFTFVSASRDTTIRVWELEGVVTRLRYNAAFDCSLHRIIPELSESTEEQKKVDEDLSCSDSLSEYQNKKNVGTARLITTLSPMLHGAASAELNKSIVRASELVLASSINEMKRQPECIPTNRLDLAKNFYRIFTYFSGVSGSMDLWENIISLLNAQSASKSDGLKLLRNVNCRSIIHEDEILSKANVEAHKNESALKSRQRTKGSDLSAKVEEQLRTTALQYARLGKFAKYCSIMVELNDFPAALAMAPAVSHEYWKELSLKYAQQMFNNQSEVCIPHLLGIGKDVDAVDFYLKRQDAANAMVVAKMSEQRIDLIPDHIHAMQDGEVGNGSLTPVRQLSVNASSSKHFSFTSISPRQPSTRTVPVDEEPFTPVGKSAVPLVRDRTEQEVENSRLIVRGVSQSVVNSLIQSGQPLLAAAQCISVGDVTSAINILSNSYEFDHAYAVALCFGLDTTPHLIDMADRCANLNAITLSVEMLRCIQNQTVAEIEIGLLLSRYCTESKYRRIISQLGLRRVEEWLEIAKEEEAIGSDADCVISFIIARQSTKAASVGLSALKKYIREPFDLSASNKKLLRGLKYLKASELEESLKISFLATLLWFSAHDAISLGLLDTAASMLSKLVDVTLQNPNCVGTISSTDVKFQLLYVHIANGSKPAALVLMKNLLSEMTATEHNKTFDCVQRLSTLLNESSSSSGPSNQIASSAVISATSRLKGDAVWGKNSAQIWKDVQLLCELLSLPSLSSSKRSKSPVPLEVSTSVVDKALNAVSNATVLQGSLLPAANQKNKGYVSIMSSKRISGRSVQLCYEMDSTFVGANELVSWHRVNPFSPMMNGDIIYL